MKILVKILPHVTIVLSAMFITFWILDIYNPLMNLLGCSISKILILIFCISSMITSILAVAIDRKNEDLNQK